MDPLTMLLISAGMKAVPSLIKGISGINRQKDASELLSGTRPQATIPESTDEMVELFKTAAGRTEIPGQDIITGDIKAGTAGGIQAALEAGPGSMGAITQMVGKEQEAISGLGVPLAQMRMAAEGQLGQALFRRGETEKEMEEWNKIQAWKEKYYEGQRRLEKGKEDVFSGFGSLFEAGGSIFSGLLGSEGGLGGASDDPLYDVAGIGEAGKTDDDEMSAWGEEIFKNWKW